MRSPHNPFHPPGSAPDQHQRRLPAGRRTAGRRRRDRHALDLRRQEGGAPLWQETQTIALDGQGRYTLLLGATQADGIPPAVFGSGDAQWLGTVFERAGEVEGPRVRITSVPYALRAVRRRHARRPAGLGLPAGAAAPADAAARSAAAVEASARHRRLVLPGTANFLAKYVNGADVGNSAVFENGGRVGSAPRAARPLHVRFTNSTGGFTGYAVQNMGEPRLAYSGMLFYDQNGALGQFQGFNNSTHEYRINNIAECGGRSTGPSTS